MRYFILILLSAFAFSADLPPEVQKCVDTYTVEVAKPFVTYKEITFKASNKCEGELKKLQDKYTQKGDLDNANAVKALRDKLRKEELLADAENKAKEGMAQYTLLGNVNAPIKVVSAVWETKEGQHQTDVSEIITKHYDKKTNTIKVAVTEEVFGEIQVGISKTLTVVYTQGNSWPVTVKVVNNTNLVIPQPIKK